MELAAKRFARWVILIHLLLLAGVVALVYSAAARTYQASQTLAIQQASRVQMLLAEQTQRGIESYYSSVAQTLQLFEWIDPEEGAAPPPMIRNVIAPSLWEQLRNRATHFTGVNRRSGVAGLVFPEAQTQAMQQLVRDNLAWLRSVRGPSISPVVKMDGKDVNLVAATGPRGGLILVAVVPLSYIEEQFLQNVLTAQMSAMIFDQDMRIVSAYEKELVGLSMTQDPIEGNANVQGLARQYVQTGTAGTEIVEQPFRIGGHEFNRGMVSIRPMQVLNSRLWLTIGSDLSDVESALQTSFWESLRWGIFLVLSLMLILASTSSWLIRSRIRVERMKHAMLTRELEEARRIQLAWLPRNDQDPPNVDLSAVNKPASHISGDFYNWFNLPDGRVCVVIGDVTGHGMAAAFLMATTQLLVRIVMPRASDAGKCLEAVNHQLCKQVFNGQFVTMQILILDREHGRVELASAGHPPPLIRHGGVFAPMDMEPQLVLGIEQGQEYVSQAFELPTSATMLMYTDGVIEARSPAGGWMGIDGLCKSLDGKSQTAEALADEVVRVVDRYRGELELVDDLTLVAIHLDRSTANRRIPMKELMNDPRR